MTTETSADGVTLTDLEVIQRWSLAVRQASADRGELIETLRSDLAWLEGRKSARASDDEDEEDAAPRRTRTATRRTPAKSTASRAKSTSARKTTTTRRASTRRG
jgi:hypothetical protein